MKTVFLPPVLLVIAAVAGCASPPPGGPANQLADAGADLKDFGPAPELAGIAGWINSEPLTIAGLRGKVVLVDFWTYSCINCIRTLPYLKAWDAQYRDQGLVMIGVHTPEFDFEKDYNNVKQAVENYGIAYPVAQDNDYQTWRAYRNAYWPRKYLIGKEGRIRYDHIGEGGYEETEAAIRALLDAHMPMTSVTGEPVDYRKIQTPEIYLGYQFARAPLGNPEGFQEGQAVTYHQIPVTVPNIPYLSGTWKNLADHVEAVDNATLSLAYTAKMVHIVAGGAGQLDVLLDGKRLEDSAAGADVGITQASAIAAINGQRLYRIISAPDYGTHTVTLAAQGPVEIYTFTFG